MTLTLVIGTIAVTSAGAGGRAEPGGAQRGPEHTVSAATPSADQPSAVAYWHRLAVKRLRLLGARERRIVRLMVKIHKFGAGRGSDTKGAGARKSRPTSVRGAICSVFGAHCSEALRVAWCESRWNVHATNGQYWGLFQFGSFARARYGFAWDAWTQARAAYRYFLDAGWSPWECRP